MKNLISQKKAVYPVSDFLGSYLERYQRISLQAVRYEDLLRYNNAIPLYNETGHDTLWSTVFYPQTEHLELQEQLRMTYATLKADGDPSAVENLYIDRVDVCNYGNTLPFRVRIVNRLNENFDYFYIKRVDANRVYGLELAHILSPSRINYFIHDDTIIEEHTIGIPANAFIRDSMPTSDFDRVRMAKEFVKFNERCFICLLGDMHSGNFVVDVTRDFEKWHYRMRPIDFDQQSHHWHKHVYLPQHFPQNKPMVDVVKAHLAMDNVVQYQKEERSLLANRIRVSHGRFTALMEVMTEDLIAPQDHVARLRAQLSKHYGYPVFNRCLTMGEIVHVSIRRLLQGNSPATRLQSRTRRA